MLYEVEVKYPLERNGGAARLTEILDLLAALGARKVGEQFQQDFYFAHPARDFRQTDEALRIRVQDQYAAVTYKGPKVDQQTKTRREIEVPLRSVQDAERFGELLRALGFRRVREVTKRRVVFHLNWQQRDVEVCLDEVTGLGLFVEMETAADQTTCDAARRSVLELAERLGLAHGERRSYLELLLEQDASSQPGPADRPT